MTLNNFPTSLGVRCKKCLSPTIQKQPLAPSSGLVRARTSKADRVFYLRMDDSTRELPEDEVQRYLAATTQSPEAQ